MLTIGKLLCLSAMHEGKRVTYVPSYGSEVRGGTAHCHVVISEEPIYNPMVEKADSLIILNELSFERFAPQVGDGGLLIVNSSLVDSSGYARRDSVTMVAVPATETAAELGNTLVANVVMLGAFVRASSLFSDESVMQALEEALTGEKRRFLEPNRKAYAVGSGLAEKAIGG